MLDVYSFCTTYLLIQIQIATGSNAAHHHHQQQQQHAVPLYNRDLLPASVKTNEQTTNILWVSTSLGFIIFVGIVIWCFAKRGEQFINAWSENRRSGPLADWYASAIRARNAQTEEESKLEPPAERKLRLVESFTRNNVRMIVKESDFIDPAMSDDEEHDFIALDILSDGSVSDDNKGQSTHGLDSIVSRSSIILQLPEQGEEKVRRSIPNLCAVCLCPYEVGDSVIWAYNSNCPHAFHEDCIIQWLVKMRKGTPCPCCRQEFTDLQQQVVGSGSDDNVISPTVPPGDVERSVSDGTDVEEGPDVEMNVPQTINLES
mmetsp:Transcript_33881/g.41549  ORF Transcript_33881/g.41549 Transcript_33881/m.41549 type:complete len:317 (-) Transcript_33881:142-1092(-)|eukprot:CAMPEP_0172496088 /NCGR_PEP_ID=MMETSP1066-20121228/81369_1 /TAXON_ID=671091 /ORGANISM="Coscinodiscus wailesii, Strain CCMP2513" /LENGTH=316 /DNA_ID=CAMNT_0013268187 /DNA_START=80 /DNA_END=1030 /DNA_ORIENTATION=+